MSKNRGKRMVALMMTFALLLSGSGDMNWAFASSVMNDTTTSETSDVEQSKNESTTETDNNSSSIANKNDNQNNSGKTTEQEDTASGIDSNVTNENTVNNGTSRLSLQGDSENVVMITDMGDVSSTGSEGEQESGTNLPVISDSNNNLTLGEIEANKLYLIQDYNGWIALANYSQDHDLTGYRFKYNMLNGTAQEYDLASQTDFLGLGSEENPFAGELSSNYTFGNLKLKLNKPLFSYLSSKAKIDNNTIEMSGSSCAGIAEHLIVKNDDSATYMNIKITTSTNGVSITTGVIGGMFADVTVDSGKTLTLKGSKVSIEGKITGETAGGLIGKLHGSATIDFSGFDLSALQVHGISNTETGKGCVGGFIGSVINEKSSESKLKLIGSDDSVFEITHNYNCGGNSEYCGGFFGHIQNTTVDIFCPIKYSGDHDLKSQGIMGFHAGGFAGCIENSSIVLHRQVICEDVIVNRPSYQTDFKWEDHGVGLFVGTLKDSEISVSDFAPNDTAALVIRNTIATGTNDNNFKINGSWLANFMNNSSSETASVKHYNAGFVAGLASDSSVKFGSTNNCTIYTSKVDNAYGNAGGAIGRMVAATEPCTLENIEVPKDNQINLMNRSGHSGGLVGEAYLKNNNNITISNCNYKGYFRFSGKKVVSDPMAVGVIAGGVSSDEDATGKFILDNVNLEFNSNISDDAFPVDAFGCAVGEMNSDFEIKNSSIVSRDNKAITYRSGTMYLGGLIGKVDSNVCGLVEGTKNAHSPMKIEIPYNRSDKAVDKQYENADRAYGGLFGYVGKGTAISLSGNIYEKNSKLTLSKYCYPTYAGSIVGELDDALVYMESDTIFTTSKNYNLNEVGNYGGVIRNKDWDSESETETNKLIQNFKVTGTLDSTIDTMGDLLRLAIALNTEGAFLPASVNFSEEESSLSSDQYDTIRKADYAFSKTEYDLTATGLSCLSRNDEKGISKPFQGSLKGMDEKTKIIYGFCNNAGNTNYSQPYSGLFSAVEDGKIENLDLQYYFSFAMQDYFSITRAPQQENVGGIAAIASGNISVNNVSYSGTIQDVNNSDWDETEKIFRRKNKAANVFVNKDDDYMGGLFGKYIGSKDSTLNIGGVSCNMSSFSIQDYTHVMGGMIGYVDLDTKLQEGESCSITLNVTQENPVSLSGNLNVQSLYSNTSGNFFPVRIGGFIAQIGSKRSDCYVSKCNLNINGLNIDGLMLTESNVSNDSEIGGLLGWQWNDVNVSLSDCKVGETKNTGLSVNAPFGGLVHTIAGKMTASNLTIETNMKLDAQNSDVDQCGLLVRNGQYLYLNVLGYKIKSPDTLLDGYTKTDFDEVAGFTKGGDDIVHGGIVSIGRTDADIYYLGRHDAYESFATIHVTNPNTRYYYDLNKLTWANDSISNTQLDSGDDFLRWHLLHYANSYLWSTMNTNYVSVGNLPASYTVGGTTENPIDLTGYSIYPTPVDKETYTGGVIKFNAKSINEGEKTKYNTYQKYTDIASSQHYQMQAGLFDQVTGVSVKDLTLQGTYSKSDSFAGALVAGKINGVIKKDEDGNIVTDSSGKTLYDESVNNLFQNIDLNNLWCVSSQNSISYDAPIGLMIADITSGAQVKFDGVTMTGYTDEAVGQSKAASALIGNVGGTDATYISLNFKNMDIADAVDGKAEINSSKLDEALAKASFIYQYNYADNCNGIYTFTYEDYLNGRCVTPNTKQVTLGQELGNKGGDPNYANEEYYDWDFPVGQMKTEDDEKKIVFDCNNYLPYVCSTEKKLLINPKTGHLAIGCGTYEDPYIISSTRQLLTLYRYLYEADKFNDILIQGQWSVNPTGTDEKQCDKTDDSTTGHGTAVVYTGNADSNFPTQAQLSQAYYEITADIDLSDYPEFTGFGTVDLPFVGVFIGNSTPPESALANEENTSYPVITMPKMPNTTTMSNFGWIQNAKGCVIKDLVIKYSQPVSIDQTVTYTEDDVEKTKSEGGVGGGVIATVLGGENIIDHVKVTGTCFTPKNTKTEIGGYVGRINVGGVILRNLNSYQLHDFQVNFPDNSNVTEYLNTCGVIGKVYDGYAVYDGGNDNTTPLLIDISSLSDFTGKSNLQDSNSNAVKLEQSSSYDILNSAYLKEGQINAGNVIRWENNGFTNISNAKQLQILSMALNSGLFNYDANIVNDTPYLYDGYNRVSRQRSGDYSYVGRFVTDSSADSNTAFVEARNAVIKYDNENNASVMQYHSYLSQWFNWDAMVTRGSNNWNPYDSVINYTLSNATYDMSVFGKAFRGLGGRYFDENYQSAGKTKANVFHGNIVGNGAKISLAMYVDAREDAGYAAFCNNILPSTTRNIKISDITISGTVINSSKVISDNTSEKINVSITQGGTKNAAALIAGLSNVDLTLENVLLQSVSVQSEHYAGGMIAVCDSSSGSITCNSCGITGEENRGTSIKGCTDTGGFIGYSKAAVIISPIAKLEYMDVECIADPASIESKNAGGLIGTIEQGITVNGSVADPNGTSAESSVLVGNKITVKTTGDKENVQIGGLVGRSTTAGKSYSFSNLTLKNLTVENSYDGVMVKDKIVENDGIIGTGGIIGAIGGTATMTNITIGSEDPNDNVKIQNISEKIPYHNSYCTGGLVGRHITNTSMTMTNCKVLGTNNNNSYTSLIKGCGSSTAGMIGNSNTFTGTDLIVKGVSIEAGRYAGGVIGWGETDKQELAKVTVEDVSFRLYAPSENFSDIKNTDLGDIGGVIGRSTGTVSLSDLTVNSIRIYSDYCKNAGGIIGHVSNNKYKISININSQNSNIVTDSYISGQNAGGVYGRINSNNNSCYVTVSNNKIISSREDGGQYTNTTDYGGRYKYGTAGGFAGCLDTDGNEDVYANHITITNNCISAYYTASTQNSDKNSFASLGGGCGYVLSKMGFYDITLKNNAIGMMKVDSSESSTDNLPNDSSVRMNTLLTTTIAGNNNASGLRNYLYYVTDSENSGSCGLSPQKIDEYTDDSLTEETSYKYTYLQGTFAGNVYKSSDDRIVKFINVRVDYTEPIYRPLADVGASGDAALNSNTDMYQKYRDKSIIVYDGMNSESTSTISENMLNDATISDSSFDDTRPYVFQNIESIMNGSATLRMRYRLENNYQDGQNIDSSDSKKSLQEIFKNTYKDNESSQFQIPMIVYKSNENGKLDEVIQSYINILTNNSGGVHQDYYGQQTNGFYETVSVYSMNLENGKLTLSTDGAQVSFSRDSTSGKYYFDSTDGDDYSDSQNGSFSLIRIQYHWNYKNTSKFTSWTLDIPVYVEKRLKLTTNMRMLEGIRYNTKTLKNGNYVLANPTPTTSMILSKGASYSIYSEFIYEDSDKFSKVMIPKCLRIDAGVAAIYFAPKTKLTLIPLDEGGKPYYYQVPDNATELQSIDFTSFKDSNDQPYNTMDITEELIQKQETYEDICSDTHDFQNVKVERFVILADTSATNSTNASNQIYSMHVTTSANFESDEALYSRTDQTEHCYARINEILGVSYKINTSTEDGSTHANTYLQESSKVSEDGKVGVHLRYDITADPTYWGSVTNAEATYLDVGFSLAYKSGGADSALVKVPLPTGTIITLGTGDNQKKLPVTGNQTTAYYYQSLRQAGVTGKDGYEHINELSKDTTRNIDFGFDFTSADLSSLDAYSDGTFYVVAELVVMGDGDLPAAGDIRATWEHSINAEFKSDFGFALNVKDLTTLGMNQYSPEESDQGVIPYTASIAFPEKTEKLESRFYTIIYQIEEKTSQANESGKPIYQRYTGDKVSLYLGEFDSIDTAKSASENAESTTKTGRGIIAVTYKFTNDQITKGTVLTDGKTASGSESNTTANVIKTHCTLVANCEGLNMTNYRVKAYLLVTDSVPMLTTSGNASSNESKSTASTTLSGTDISEGCLKHYWLRDGNWPTISSDVLTSDLKSDYFVFTVAKIKTSM